MAKEEEVALGDADVHPAAFPVPAEKYGEVSPLAHSLVKGLIPYRRRITSRVVNLQSETVDLVVQNWRRVVDRLDDAAWNAGQALKRGQAGTFLIPNAVDGWTSVAAAIACGRKNDEDLRSGDMPISRRDCVTRWFVSQMKGNTTRFATKRGRDAATSQLELQPFLEFLASYSTSRRAAATVIDDVLVVVGESGLRCPPDVIHCEPYAVVSQELHSLEASTAEHSTGLAALREFFEGRSVESVVLSYPPTEATHVVLKTLEAAMEWFSSQPPQNDDALKPSGTSHHGDDEWTMDRALNLFLAAARAVKHNNPLPVSAPLDAAFTDLEQRHQRVQVLTAAVGELKRIREGHGSKADFRTKTVVAWATKAASILSGVLGRERRQMTLTYTAQLAEYRRALQREWSVILRPLGKLRRIDWIESVTTTGDVPCEVLVHAYCQQLLKDWIDEPKYAGLADAGALQRPPVDLSDVSIYLSSPLSFVGALYFHSGIVLTSTAMVPWLPPVDIDPRVPKRALEDGAPTVVYQHVKADALQSAIRRFQRSYLSAAADQNE